MFHSPRFRTLSVALATAVLAVAGSAAQAVTIGQPAPEFSLADVSGKPVKLADFKGKYVVLEWTNPGCPFVQKHYNSGNMQKLQQQWTAQNVAWLTINSTNAGHGDYLSPEKAAAKAKDWNQKSTALLLDSDGKVGNAYEAKTTPHMYIVDPAGKLVYAGAIDDKRSTRIEDVKTANNYVLAALSEATAGKPVTHATTQPYGCSVKY